MSHAAATDVAHPSTVAATNGRKAGGQLTAMFPNREVVWIDDELKAAIALACSIEKERGAVLLRRWLRKSAIAEGYLAMPRPVA
jgi:hypothetical protein